MLELLQTHLQTCFAPAEGDLIEEAIRLMAEMNMDSDDFFSGLFMEWEQGLVPDLNDGIRAAVMTDAQNVLTSHGITLIEEATLSDYTKFLRYFVAVEAYENQEQLHMIATSEEMDSVEKMATAMNEVLMEDVDCLMVLLENVPESAIAALATFALARMNEEPQGVAEALDSRLMTDMLNKFATAIQGKDMQCYKHVFEAEAAVGLPLQLYWNTYNSYLTALPVQALVYEMIGFAIISEETEQNPADVIGDVLSTYYGEDIDKVAYARTLVNQTLIQFRNEVGSGLFIQRPEAVNAQA